MGKKPRHHEIDLPDFQEWLQDAEMVYASSSRERKTLSVMTNGNFVVRVAGKQVWTGTQPYDAVEAYNAITEKYKDEKPDFTL